MISKFVLKHLCLNCEYHLSLSNKLCPFRSISNEYCDEYIRLLKYLEVLEIIKNNACNVFNTTITFKGTLSEKEFNLLKEVLLNENK